MSLWPDDFSTLTLQEALGWQAENRAWSRELRFKNNTLVNNRLANLITQADYLDNRKIAQQETAECRRRALILDAQIARHTVGVRS